jgi:hypothetical protein
MAEILLALQSLGGDQAAAGNGEATRLLWELEIGSRVICWPSSRSNRSAARAAGADRKP